MNKKIKIMSIISVILSCIALLISLAILTFLWNPINVFLNHHESIIEAGPIIPIGTMVSMAGCLIVAMVLFISHKTKRHIVIEVLSIVFLVGVLPILTDYLSMFQSVWIGGVIGDGALSRLGIPDGLLILPIKFTSISSVLCLVICGMRVAYKINYKKQQRKRNLLKRKN